MKMQIKRFFLTLIVFFSFLPLGFTQDGSPFIQVIYFRASDMPPQPNVDAKIDTLIKKVQRFYADEMERHGFGRKTFQIETGEDGNTIVHHVVGKFTYAHYIATAFNAHDEIYEQISIPWWSIPIFMVERHGKTELPGGGCGSGHYTAAQVNCWGWDMVAHELGHAFDLPHDQQNYDSVMSYNLGGYRLSQCFAEWLNVHSFFNVGQPPMTKDEWMNNHTFSLGLHDQITTNERRGIKMLPPSLASPPNNIRLRFEVTDPDGLHHAFLGARDLTFCKSLSGESSTIEFVTSNLGPKDTWVTLDVIDVRGNTTSATYSNVNLRPLFPPPEVVSIADANLAATVRKWLRLAPEKALTTYAMSKLESLVVDKSQITDLTGLEHAHLLIRLYLNDNPTLDISEVSVLSKLTQLRELSLNKNRISNISALAELTHLRSLYLYWNRISDISPLTELKHLTNLSLSGNTITDISPLAGLARLNVLDLRRNRISDISPLTGLKHLAELSLDYNAISDISPLAELTQLIYLGLNSTSVSDISALAGLTRLELLSLNNTSVSDISALAGLTRLENLYLSDNSIVDISDLAGLTRLELLSLNNTSVSDISALAGLTRLENLYLSDNDISDISPLLALNLTGTSLTPIGLHLEGNPLSFASINTHIPALQAKGIEVKFDNVAHPALVKSSGDQQEGTAGAPLASPFVLEAQDENGQPMRDTPVTFTIRAGSGILSPSTTKTDAEGKARTFLTLGWTPGTTIIRATAEGMPAYVHFTATATVIADRLAEDVNGDGEVDVEDLLFVAASFGTLPAPDVMPNTDVNGDGVINNEDMLLVLAALEGAPAAPALNNTQWTVASLQRWITEAKRRNITDATFLKGIAVLEQWLTELLPKETSLLANYPNPFNPETWIPYQLSEPSKVTLHIYAVNGGLVRTLALGHQPAGMYHGKNRAAYWDGRNAHGESIASGVYFYTLTAGDFTATRKMLIKR